YNFGGSSASMNDVIATASGGSYENHGVVNLSSSTTMNSMVVTASGGELSIGVDNNSSSLTMNNVTATASGGTTLSYGMRNIDASPNIRSSAIKGEMAGLYNLSSGTILVQNSQISGTGNAVYVDSGTTLRVGGSNLNGGPFGGVGTQVCAGNYDENYAFFPSTCP
ncbi:MAG: hypothetical protein M3014_02080, partial [Chloroflexota bacterium]|nr:hypothetical protein [Chloroflexota bacterium]